MMAQWDAFWRARNERERMLLLVAAVMVLMGLIYLMIILPLGHAVEEKKRELNAAQVTLQWMQQVAPLAKKQHELHPLSRVKLLGVLATELKKTPLEQVKHELQQVGMQQIQLSFKAVPYALLMTWLLKMNQAYVFSIKQLTIDKTSSLGVVNAMFVIEV